MQQHIVVTLSLFGNFRHCFAADRVSIPLTKGAGLVDLRAAFKRLIVTARPESVESDLVDYSAFADDKNILCEDAVFDADIRIAILPPVCGG